ncbi:MAG: hypothetical protein ACM3UP_01475 [Methanocella sp.]
MDWAKLADHGTDIVAVVGVIVIVLKLLSLFGPLLVRRLDRPNAGGESQRPDALDTEVLDALRSNTEAMTRLGALIERQGETMDRMGEALQRQTDMIVKLQVELARQQGRAAS